VECRVRSFIITRCLKRGFDADQFFEKSLVILFSAPMSHYKVAHLHQFGAVANTVEQAIDLFLLG